MTQRVTAKSVTTQQDDINREHNRADADSKSIIEPERFPNVVAQNQNKNECEIQKIAMHVLHDERERALAPITLARLTDRTRRWIRPECFIISAAIIITGQSKSARRPQN